MNHHGAAVIATAYSPGRFTRRADEGGRPGRPAGDFFL